MNLLDNPIWNSLRTRQACVALGDEQARRYPAEIGPLSGIAEETPACYGALRALLAGATDVVVLFLPHAPQPVPGWNLLRSGPIHQMVRGERIPLDLAIPEGVDLRKLDGRDAAAMVELAELTEPGPFRLRTLELGTFYGVFEGGRLAAMAGKRMHLPGHVEVSGVCTHPEARGRGYARLLMSLVIDEIERDDDTAFLHVLIDNPAIRLYESLGFRIRRSFHFAALGTDASRQAAPHAPKIHGCG